MGNCGSKRPRTSTVSTGTPKAKVPALQWEHFTKPDWGIDDMLVPDTACIRRDENGHMIGDLSYPDGRFKIHPLLNKMSLTNLSNYMESQQIFIKVEEDADIRAKLNLPEDDYVAITLTDHDSMGLVHHALLKSPHQTRHTLVFSFMLPLAAGHEAPKQLHQITQKMLSSLTWVDRTTVCTPVDKLVGSWLHVKEQRGSQASPTKSKTVKKMKFFEENLWGYWHWERRVPDNVEPEDLAEGKHDMKDFATGDYVAYEYNGHVYLYLVNTWNWAPILIETVSLSADGAQLVRLGDTYKNVESGQPYRPTVEEVFGKGTGTPLDQVAHDEGN